MVLGCVVFLIVGILSVVIDIEKRKTFKWFMITYNVALPYMTIMFLVRGSLQVVGANLTAGKDGMLLGFAGIAHILMAIAIVLFFVSLLKSSVTISKNDKIE